MQRPGIREWYDGDARHRRSRDKQGDDNDEHRGDNW